jgi:hypothetical protein
MEFDAPANAPAHQALIQAVTEGGYNREALRRLLWLINAHPKLVAHVRVFQRVHTILASECCTEGALTWAAAWKDDIPAWSQICEWIVAHGSDLSQQSGLEEFDRKPRSADDHPHMNFGIARHAVAAALWSTHQSAKPNAHATEPMTPLAERFAELQSHLFLSYSDSRFRNTTLEFYEQYTGDTERPISPALTAGVGLALREFTRNAYGALLQQFPANRTTPEFAAEFVATLFQNDQLESESHSDGVRYADALRRYFRRFLRVLQGWKPPQIRRRGGGGGGGHRRRPGFVHFARAKGVYLVRKVPRPDDPDIPYLDLQAVYIDRDDEFDDDPASLEASGLSPEDIREPEFQLYTPAELNSRLAAARYQRLAIEMHGQFLPFSYANLTPVEIHQTDRQCEQEIAAYLTLNPRNIQIARRRAMGALMIKVMLYLGQSFTVAHLLRFAWRVNPDDPLPVLADDVPALLLSAMSEGDWGSAQVIGFCMPAIAPAYKTDLSDDQEEISRTLVESFLLPDLLGLGQQLLDFLRKEHRPNARIFGIEPVPAKQAVAEVINADDDKRITPDKIARVLPALLMQLTGDQSLVWITTADYTCADEPRMHYTRHTVQSIERVYRSGIRRLARQIGVTPPVATDSPSDTLPDEALTVGARFVIRFDELKNLISDLVAQLREPRRTPLNASDIGRYHDAYLLYTWIFQSLHTTLRAVTRPNALYRTWQRVVPMRRFSTSLSDKDGRYTDKARLVAVTDLLAEQFGHYKLHIEHVIRRLGLRKEWTATSSEDVPLLVLTNKRKLVPFKPGWAAAQLKERFAPLPENFHRAFLRTELLQRGCPAETVDAFMGHANAGESPFSRYSTFDYGLHLPQLKKILDEIHTALGLVPVPSRLVPYSTRLASL